MEAVGTISEGQYWNNFLSDEADFMSQLLGNFSIPNEVPNISNFSLSSPFWPSHDHHDSNFNVVDSSMYSSDETNSILSPSLSQGISYDPPSHVSRQFLMNNNNFTTMDYCVVEYGKSNVVEGDEFLNQDVSNDSFLASGDVFQGKNDLHLGKRVEKPIQEPFKEEKSKKRPRNTPGELQRSKRSMKLKSCPKLDDNENNNTNMNHASCSEDDSSASHELSGVASTSSSKKSGALNLTGKTRANRGAATDPQSLYARKRRERINERLRILQKLVPNGTKVDISTMLEEAVQYVKFLQLQIRLLSSDDLWMYAPIAYNGMDLGLDLKISIPRSQS